MPPPKGGHSDRMVRPKTMKTHFRREGKMLPIKAIPTRYAGVNFRSRLEARWAAMFDLIGWEWEYEPVDFEHWIPDFRLLFTPLIYAEVKPVIFSRSWVMNAIESGWEPFDKAADQAGELAVLLLGDKPLHDGAIGIGFKKGEPLPCGLCEDADAKWREAGNLTQWRSIEDSPGFERLITQLTRIADALERK